MKRLTFVVFFLLALAFFYSNPGFASAAAYAPAVGGTGTTTPPKNGQLLVGNAAKTYTLTATSSLGLPTFADLSALQSFSTTSADYWKTQRNFHSTTSADYWLTTKSTTDLVEGTNLYWTNGRFDTRLSGTTSLPNITTLANLGTVKTTLSGLLKATAGVLSTASAGSDYENPLTFSYPLSRAVNAVSLLFGTTTPNTWSAHNIFASLFATNASTTNATTSALHITSLDCTGNANGGALTADANGRVSCSDDDSGAAAVAPPFSFASTFSTSTAATTSSIWTKGVFFSTSTTAASQFPYSSSTAATIANLFATNLTIGGDTFDELLGDGLDISSGDLIFDCSDVAGTGITCSGENITAEVITAGDALTRTGDDIDFDGGATPAGDLGGTWASPSVTDDSHAHTSATISGLDISADTNLTAGDGLTLTDDDLDCDTASGSAFGCLTSVDWTTFNNKAGFGYLFAVATRFGTTTAGTSTSISTQGAFYASSTVAASQFPYASSTALTVGNLFATNATTTSLSASSFTFGGVNSSSWSGFCVSITGSAALCDGDDASGGGGGGAFPFTPVPTHFGKATNATTTQIAFTDGLTASSTVTYGGNGTISFIASANGGIGIGGTTTPWGLLSIATTTPNYTKPLLTIATSSDMWGQLFMVSATTTGVGGPRVAIGESALSLKSAMWPLYVNGPSYSNYRSVSCENPASLASQTGNAQRLCAGAWSFLETTNGATIRTLRMDGLPMITVYAGLTAANTAVTASGGAALIYQDNSVNGGVGWATASTTIYFETYIAASSTNATSTIFQAGLAAQTTAGSSDSISRQLTGYYFMATSSGWMITANNGSTSGTFTSNVTGIPATSTAHTLQKLSMVAYPTGPASMRVDYYIDDMFVGFLTPSYPATQLPVVGGVVIVGAQAAGLAKSFDFSYIRVWTKTTIQ